MPPCGRRAIAVSSENRSLQWAVSTGGRGPVPPPGLAALSCTSACSGALRSHRSTMGSEMWPTPPTRPRASRPDSLLPRLGQGTRSR